MTYSIAIPSYNRSDILLKKTLATLIRHQIPFRNIYVFVADATEYDIYRDKLSSIRFPKDHIITGEKGLKNQRNFISKYFKEGANIVEMDDDLGEIYELYDAQLRGKQRSARKSAQRRGKLRPIGNLDEFIKEAFKICRNEGIYLWGVYPTANPYFMTPTITRDLRFIVGPFWGMINRHDKRLQLTVDEKENSERTLQYYTMDGSVLRFNGISIETTYYKTPGGMQTNSTRQQRIDSAFQSALVLHSRYPDFTRISIKKKSKWPELILRNSKTKKRANRKTKNIVNM